MVTYQASSHTCQRIVPGDALNSLLNYQKMSHVIRKLFFLNLDANLRIS